MFRFNSRIFAVLIFAASLAISFALFGNGIAGDFVFDDKIVIVGNPLLEEKVPPLILIFRSPYHAFQPKTGLYRPLTIASYAFNTYLFGTAPTSFHIINIILHAIVVFFIFLVAKIVADIRVALVSSLLFLVLPIHVEDVTSIVGRAELLALLFSLLALYSAMRGKYVLATLAFFLGLLSKESAVAFVPVWFAWEYFFNRQALKIILRKFLFFVFPLLIYGLLRYAALGEYVLANDATAVYNPLKFASFFDTLWTSGKILFLYLQKTFVPTVFSSDYSFNQIHLVHNPFLSFASMAGIVLLVGLITLAIWKRRTPIGWSAFIFLAFYFVISNLIFKTGTIMAERLMYAPSLGLVLLAALGAEYVIKKIGSEKIVYAVLGLALIFYSYKTIDRNRDWLNEERLFETALAAAPNSVVNRTNLAYLKYVKNDYQAARQEAEAVLALVPEHIPALNLFAQSNKKLGNIKIAEDYWKRAVQIRPDYVRGYLGLGVLYYENGYFTSAEQALTDAIKIFPRWSEVLYLSLTKTALKKYDEAIAVVQEHFGDNPERSELKFALGVAYYKKGDRDRAMVYLRQVQNPALNQEEFLKTIEKNIIFLITDL